MSNNDYYKTLGVSKNAPDDEIKRSYRKLAMKYHPDHTKGDKSLEEKFKKISEAYAVLSNKEKRKQYDNFGSTGFHQRFSQEDIFRDFDISSIFKEFGFGGTSSFQQRSCGNKFSFGSQSPFGSGHSQQQAQIKGSDIEYELPIYINEVVSGTTKTLTLKYNKNSEKVTIKVPKGMSTGKKLRIPGKGEQSPYGGNPGDLFIRIKVINNSNFRIDGHDLYLEQNINLTDSILGSNISVPTIDGKKLNLSIPTGSKHKTKFRLSGHGLPYLKSNKNGNLFVGINVNIPKKLTKDQISLLEKLKDTGI